MSLTPSFPHILSHFQSFPLSVSQGVYSISCPLTCTLCNALLRLSLAAVFGRLTSDPSSPLALELCSPTGSHHTHTHTQPLRLVFQHLSTTQSLSLHTKSIRSSVPSHLHLSLAEWNKKASVLVLSHPLRPSSTRLASACVGAILNKLLWSTWNHKNSIHNKVSVKQGEL